MEQTHDSDVFLQKLEELEELLGARSDIIGYNFDDLRHDYDIDTYEETIKELEKIHDDNRKLRIGIIGEVKAGKSSLLNSLFFNGNDILPKAATPMTTALTVLKGGTSNQAEIHFFTDEDIASLEKQRDIYKERVKDLTEEKFKAKKAKRDEAQKRNGDVSKDTDEELWKKAKEDAEKELKLNIPLAGAAQQCEEIEKGARPPEFTAGSKKIDISDNSKLSEALSDYIGASGTYTAFTKSVELTLCDNHFNDIEVVDTPGFNDPVPSRNGRAEALLRDCDMVLILSQAGSFMKRSDFDLMDRVVSRKAINEVWLIASKVDDELFSGSILKESKGDVFDALDNIIRDISETALSGLDERKADPDFKRTYENLINKSSEKITHSSGLCRILSLNFANQERWDSEKKTLWKNLSKNYPDYFDAGDSKTAKTTLDKISNHKAILEIIKNAEKEKDKILNERKAEFISKKSKSFNKLLDDLEEKIEEEKKKINTSSIDTLKNLKKKLETLKKGRSKLEVGIRGIYENFIDSFITELENKKKELISLHFSQEKDEINAAEEQRSERKSYKPEWWQIWEWLQFWKERSYVEEYNIIKTAQVRAAIEAFRDDTLVNLKELTRGTIHSHKKELEANCIKLLLATDLGDIELDGTDIAWAFRSTINRISLPNLKIDFRIPRGLQVSGILKDKEATIFLASAQGYIKSLRSKMYRAYNSFLEEIKCDFNELSVSDSILDKLDNYLNELMEKVKNKKASLTKLDLVKSQIREIKGDKKKRL